jgi:hypothetical protein
MIAIAATLVPVAALASLAVPTPSQLQWAKSGYGAFIHYNMGTYVSV